jgi:CheY-like chemotaxis protein
VDDNQDAADTTAALLSVCGAETLARYSGTEALAALASFRPDVCILDISMPGMTGHELAARIRAATDDPPLLVTLTALDDYGTLKQAAESGFDLHFTKPVQPAELLQALNDYITSGKPV